MHASAAIYLDLPISVNIFCFICEWTLLVWRALMCESVWVNTCIAVPMSPVRQYFNIWTCQFPILLFRSGGHLIGPSAHLHSRSLVPANTHRHQFDRWQRDTAIRNMNAQLRKWIACQRSCVLSFVCELVESSRSRKMYLPNTNCRFASRHSPKSHLKSVHDARQNQNEKIYFTFWAMLISVILGGCAVRSRTARRRILR